MKPSYTLVDDHGVVWIIRSRRKEYSALSATGHMHVGESFSQVMELIFPK